MTQAIEQSPIASRHVLRRIRRAALCLSLAACGTEDAPDLSNDAGIHDASTAAVSDKIAAPAVNDALGRGTGCDLSGRWIMTEHQSVAVLGSKQSAISWFYVELTQEGDQVTMTDAMSCGRTTFGLPAVEVEIDDSPAWPAYMKQVRYDGRTGASTEVNDECHISFERAVLVHGATVATYRDFSVPLPPPDQQVQGEEPGWEDWDEDGHPGVTMTVTGTLSGSIYEASRTWTEYEGTAARDPGSFMLGQRWQQERVTLGYDGSPVLVYEGVRDADEAQHAVEMTRLLPDQAVGDDAAKCRSIRRLAPALTPNANAKVLP